MNRSTTDLDQAHVWHPYSAVGHGLPAYPVKSANGVRLTLEDRRELIDGMSSWWCAIHGYNHPALNAAITDQLDDMAHVMFGGLTHAPAAQLAQKLVEITPEGLDKVFLSDSGSVSIEVAMKMAIQYWHARGKPTRQSFLTIRGGYHGDTFAAMSVCDPVTGMHTLFSDTIKQQYFAPRPGCRFGEPCSPDDLTDLRRLLRSHQQTITAVILEPIVQGAGGMYFYAADYLKQVSALCDEYGVLLIADEIATGFGRTGKLFACEHAGISPDIMCVGKSLTGGYMTLAATLTTDHIAQTISDDQPGVFMHGPTFMANPLACSVALASINLLLENDWQAQVERISEKLRAGLSPSQNLPGVQEVRVLGAIGVVELEKPVVMDNIQPRFVDAGVWVRPFGKLVYLMPPFIMSNEDLELLTNAVHQVLRDYLDQ
ncbi:MAG: adenosylmethionine--8-amino-7-oxononanoate transaminase [bacterium]